MEGLRGRTGVSMHPECKGESMRELGRCGLWAESGRVDFYTQAS